MSDASSPPGMTWVEELSRLYHISVCLKTSLELIETLPHIPAAKTRLKLVKEDVDYRTERLTIKIKRAAKEKGKEVSA